MAPKPKVLAIAGSPRHNSDTGLFQQTVAGVAINFPNLFQPTIAAVKSWPATLDATCAGDLLFPGIDGKVAITKHPQRYKRLSQLGRS